MAHSKIPNSVVLDILVAATQAPSGGNSQPWRFVVEADVCRTYMLPEKDHLVLNCRNRGTLLAHGMMIETICIAARQFGYSPQVRILPASALPNLTSIIRFEQGSDRPTDKLYEAIWRRCTNRKPYEERQLCPEADHLLRSVQVEKSENEPILAFTATRSEIEELARAASISERVMFENETLHRLFFEELVWSESEALSRGSGLQLETLEIQPAQRKALKVFKHYPLMRLLNSVGAARAIAQGNSLGYAACGLYGAIACGSRDVDFVQAGRVLGRLWLTATSLGLSFHMQTGVNFLWQSIRERTACHLSRSHLFLIDEAYQAICQIFNPGGRIIPAIFRIGYADEPTTRSFKAAPEVKFIDQSINVK